MEARLLLAGELAGPFRDVEWNRRRRTLQLVREGPTTTRKLLHDVIGQHDELHRTGVHVKALMVELLHANSREGKGKGKGKGRGRGRQDTVRPYALSSRALSRSRARALAAFSRHVQLRGQQTSLTAVPDGQ